VFLDAYDEREEEDRLQKKMDSLMCRQRHSNDMQMDTHMGHLI